MRLHESIHSVLPCKDWSHRIDVFAAMEGSHLCKLFACKFPVALCPRHLAGIPLHLEILVALGSAKVEDLQLATSCSQIPAWDCASKS